MLRCCNAGMMLWCCSAVMLCCSAAMLQRWDDAVMLQCCDVMLQCCDVMLQCCDVMLQCCDVATLWCCRWQPSSNGWRKPRRSLTKGKSLTTKLSSSSAARRRLPLVFQFHFIRFCRSDVQPVCMCGCGCGWVPVFYHHSFSFCRSAFYFCSETIWDEVWQPAFSNNVQNAQRVKNEHLVWWDVTKCVQIFRVNPSQNVSVYIICHFIAWKPFTWKTIRMFCLVRFKQADF